MKDLIKYIAQALVDHPEQVEVSEVEGDRISVWEGLSGSRAAMPKPSGPY